MSCYGINKENKCYAEVYTMEESKMMAYKPNLLLNGDFKCNSGGQLVYENPAYTAQDSIDKWKIMAGKVNTSFVNYLTIESYNETGSAYFLQNFDSDKSGDFVISLKVLNINKGSFRVYFEGTNQQDSYTISSKGIYKITFRDVKNATGVCLALDNFSGDIEYIRLDEGTVPLPHMKEDYEIASLRCGQNKNMYIEELVWENPNPSNDFASQKINMDLSKYKRVCIYFRETTQYAEIDGTNKYFSASVCWGGGTTPNTVSRRATISTDGIDFSTGYDGSNESTGSMMPLKIYGIK